MESYEILKVKELIDAILDAIRTANEERKPTDIWLKTTSFNTLAKGITEVRLAPRGTLELQIFNSDFVGIEINNQLLGKNHEPVYVQVRYVNGINVKIKGSKKHCVLL